MLRAIKLIMWITGFVCLMNERLSACVCNKEGSDYCSNCTESKVITPKHPLTNEPPQVNLSPVGDNCWCSKQTVEPVVLSETCSKHKTKTCNCEISDSIINSHFADSSLYSTRLSTNQDDSPSADPVSVSLAIKAGQALSVPEAKLSYGFIQKPIEALPKTFYSSVQEENLFAHKNDVITLHKSLPIEDERQTDDYFDIDDERDALANDGSKDLRLTYKQLGYVTERLPNPKFQRFFSSASSSSSSSSSSVHDSIYYGSKENGKNSAHDLDTYRK